MRSRRISHAGAPVLPSRVRRSDEGHPCAATTTARVPNLRFAASSAAMSAALRTRSADVTES